jgi:hypothetical protein
MKKQPLLEAVIRKRLLKTLHAEEDLTLAVVFCKVWKSALEL